MNATPSDFILMLSKALVFMCFTFSIIKLDKSIHEHRILFSILLLSAANEILARLTELNPTENPWFSSIILAIHQFLWILLIIQLVSPLWRKWILAFCIVFALTDFIWLEGMLKVNCYTLVISSLLYIQLFSMICFRWMKAEEISNFGSNRFLLLNAPLLFFFGMSALLSFRNRALSTTPFWGLTLYQIINFSANVMTYSLIFFYLLRQKPRPNDQ